MNNHVVQIIHQTKKNPKRNAVLTGQKIMFIIFIKFLNNQTIIEMQRTERKPKYFFSIIL